MRFLALLLVFLCGFVAAADEVRTWTKSQGDKFQAQFLREVDGEAVFIRDGKPYTVPVDQLSENDQKLIKDIEKEKKVEETPAPLGAPAPKVELPPTSEPAPNLDKKTDRRPSLVPPKLVPEMRVWRDISGKQDKAKFVRMRDRNVQLSHGGGRPVEVPFSSLSREDQQYVRRLLSAKGESHLCPPPSEDNPEITPDAIVANMPNTATEFPDGASDLTGPTLAGNTPLHDRSRMRFGQPISPGEFPADDEPMPEMTDQTDLNVVAVPPQPELAEVPAAKRFQFPQFPKLTGKQIGALLCALTFMLIVGSAIGSVILRTAVYLFNSITGVGNSRDAVPEPSYGEGFGIIFVTIIVNIVAGVLAGLAIGFGCGLAGIGEDRARIYAQIVSIPLNVLVMSGTFSSMLPTSFLRGLVIAIGYMIVWFFIVIAIVFGVIAFGFRMS
jgi:SLA1 Homology Domain 1 (SHD1) protein